ncbi:MAG: NAD(P)H-hydrate dehydratase [Bacteroidetes bacterium]|nr:NAD(P)H-hydrate dehydratase [Bacteroidota bacterium]
MKILTAAQVREADLYTIQHTPILSGDLMERAAGKCVDWLLQNIKKQRITIICGPGNNGGDGLAIARMLITTGFEVNAFVLNPSNRLSTDCEAQLKRLQSTHNHNIKAVVNNGVALDLTNTDLIVDAIFGTGLKLPVSLFYVEIITQINDSGRPVVSIDLPSGISSDETSLITGNEIVKSTKTLTFQVLKKALLLPENAPFIGSVEVLDIGLHADFMNKVEATWETLEPEMLAQIYVPKREFSHKGNYGHSLLITGSPGKMGASVLMAKGYLKGGGGLLTTMVPEKEGVILQTTVPESMVVSMQTASDLDWAKFQVIGIGPGLSTTAEMSNLLELVLSKHTGKMVLDADALNLLAQKPELLAKLPENAILTPHPGEFRRLVGEWQNDFQKMEMLQQFSTKHKLVVILKGKNTAIASPSGKIWFNTTGNAGMAKGGSGDILTGLITSLLASGYASVPAAQLGVWLHGMAGDLAAATLTQEAMNASDIIDNLPGAWQKLIAKYHEQLHQQSTFINHPS